MKISSTMAYRATMLGESCIIWQIANGISHANSTKVLSLYRILKKQTSDISGIYDIVPAYDSLAIHYNPLEIDSIDLKLLLSRIDGNNIESFNPPRFNLPTTYKGKDLERVANHTGLSIEKVISLHSNTEYTVAMIGFTPHFPYLIGLDPRLATPRLECPRTNITAGSVAIGGAQTGVYPVNSPGGWNLIGSTEPELLTQLTPGDIVTFTEIKP